MNEQEYKEFQDKLIERDRDIYEALAGDRPIELPVKEINIRMNVGSELMGIDSYPEKTYIK